MTVDRLRGLLKAEGVRLRSRRATRLAVVFGLILILAHSALNHGRLLEVRNHLAALAAPIDRAASEMDEDLSGSEGSESFARTRADNIEFLRAAESELASQLSLGAVHVTTFGFLGSFAGVAVVILLIASLVGAEQRWGYWRTMAIHLPARGWLISVKVIAILRSIGVVLLVLYGISLAAAAAGSVFVHHPVVGGGLPAGAIVAAFAAAWLVLGIWAIIAAFATWVSRSVLAGVIISSAVLVGDGLLSQATLIWRPLSAAQAVAWLLPEPLEAGFRLVGSVWWPRAQPATLVVGPGGGFERIPPSILEAWQAVLILAAWGGMAYLAAIIWNRRVAID